MRRSSKAVLLCASWALLTSCGSQLRLPEVDPTALTRMQFEFSEESLRLFLDNQIRLTDIAYRIRVEGAELCGEEISPVLGVVAWRRTNLHNRLLKALAEEVWALTHDYRVMHVVRGSPADRVGLEPGDHILRLSGVRVGKSSQLFEVLRSSEGDPLRLTVLRGGQSLELDLERIEGCYHQAVLSSSSALLTSATGEEQVIFPMGLMRLARSDDEIALAIAHQLGHQLLPEQDDEKPKPGELLQAEADRTRREVDADRLGLYLAARAGFRIEGVIGYLERVGIEEPWRLFFAGRWHGRNYYVHYQPFAAHGFIPQRIVALRDTIDEVNDKQTRGEPLIPEAPEVTLRPRASPSRLHPDG
jgi:hypothetical protein